MVVEKKILSEFFEDILLGCIKFMIDSSGEVIVNFFHGRELKKNVRT